MGTLSDKIGDLSRIDAYTLADAARHAGVGQVVHDLRPQTRAKTFIGRARTARLDYRPNADIPLKDYGGWRLHDMTGPGEVAVLDAGGLQLSVMGALAVANMKRRGAAGAVVHGCIRDVEEMEADGLPVFALDTVITTAAGHATVTDIGEPVTFGGVRIATGDLLAGCRGGLVIVPWAEREAVLPYALRTAESDARVAEGIRAGRSVSELWALHKDLR